MKATAVHLMKEQLPAAVTTTARMVVYSMSSYGGARVAKAVLVGKDS